MINRKGTIGLTIVMLVFCLLMSVSMSYHKTIQTESLIQNNTNYSERAMDAAFSGVNYAMALIQAKKSVFNGDQIQISKTESDKKYISKWISLSQKVGNYYDSDRASGTEDIPPYRFIVSCHKDSYTIVADTFYIKSYGEYFQYEGEEVIATYTAQIIAECLLNVSKKTISLKRYRKMQPQNPDNAGDNFYKFDTVKGFNEP